MIYKAYSAEIGEYKEVASLEELLAWAGPDKLEFSLSAVLEIQNIKEQYLAADSFLVHYVANKSAEEVKEILLNLAQGIQTDVTATSKYVLLFPGIAANWLTLRW